jgi:hypothetical protein
MTKELKGNERYDSQQRKREQIQSAAKNSRSSTLGSSTRSASEYRCESARLLCETKRKEKGTL